MVSSGEILFPGLIPLLVKFNQMEIVTRIRLLAVGFLQLAFGLNATTGNKVLTVDCGGYLA